MKRLLCASVSILATAFTAPVAAQSAPEGNAHPEQEVVSRDAIGRNVLGAETARSESPMADKWAFSREVDLEPLRDLAVSHNGRVKILDTLARETVARLTGRSSYFDLQPKDDRGYEKLRYDPLFTLFDMIIERSYYADKRLLHVDFLPLRREYVETAYAGDAQRQQVELKLGRLTPEIVASYGEAIDQEFSFNVEMRRHSSRLFEGLQLYLHAEANLKLIAPDQADLPWKHLGELDEDSPVTVAATELALAWRARDAAGVNAAVGTLGELIPSINATVYPDFRRSLELTYNKSNAFSYGVWAYCLALISLMLAFGTGRRWLVTVGVTTLVLAIGLHAFGFATRCIIAERFAIQNQFESMTGLSLFATVVGLVIMLFKKQWLFGAAAAGVGFLVLITATQTGIPGKNIDREAAILNTSVLLEYHVTTVLVSYGLISLGFIVSLFYLGTHYAQAIRDRILGGQAAGVATGDDVAANALGLGGTAGHQRTLKDLDTAQMTVLQLAFWTLGVGVMLGAWWADHSWGRWWAFDPKETWALATWIIYLIVIHLRFVITGRNRALVTAWLSVVGFVMMLWTYFGVNLLLPGLHAYA